MLIQGDDNDNVLTGTNGPDTIYGRGGADSIDGGGGADTVSGGAGDDVLSHDIAVAAGSQASLQRYVADLGAGLDTVRVLDSTGTFSTVELRFATGEVGNGFARDGSTGGVQDGGLAVRQQALSNGTAVGAVSRFDDEGVAFDGRDGVRFAVRDLLTDALVGAFDRVALGTRGNDVIAYAGAGGRNAYLSGGLGADTITGGAGRDTLLGGDGADRLSGGAGADTLEGGAGNDRITGEAGDDVVLMDVSTAGADSVLLGAGLDTVRIAASAGIVNVRLTFTEAEVGANSSYDSGTRPNQDGGFAVRLQAEDGGAPAGPISRFDDEGIRFQAATSDVTFDVRDLTTGAVRGAGAFGVVYLGTKAGDIVDESAAMGAVYGHGGLGDDVITAGLGDDVLLGGAGADELAGGDGADLLLGGAGADRMNGGAGADRFQWNGFNDGADQILSGDGMDSLILSRSDYGLYRVALTPEEVGDGDSLESGLLPNQDGGLALHIAPLGGSGSRSVLRMDDEGVTIVFSIGIEVYDQVRDAVIGFASSMVLGTAAGETLQNVGPGAYVNGGAGNDVINLSDLSGFAEGGQGDDILTGGEASDKFIGGSGADILTGGNGNDGYIYRSVLDSTPDPAGRDTITDSFSSYTFIDLSRIDADPSTPQDDAFVFNATGVFTGTTRDLIAVNNGDGSYTVSADLDGDSSADFAILVVTTDVVNSGDFVL